MNKTITKDTKLKDVLKLPGGQEVLERFNTPCLHCPMSVYEMGSLKIGEIAGTYGIDLKKLLAELNRKPKVKK